MQVSLPDPTAPNVGGVPQSHSFFHPHFSNHATVPAISETFRIGVNPLASIAEAEKHRKPVGPRPLTAAKRVRTAGFGAYEGPLNTAVKGKGAPSRTLDAEVNVTGKSTVRVAETFDLRGCPVMARSDPREHLVQIEFALMIALGSCGGTMSRRRSPRIELAFSGSFPPMLRGSLCQ